MFEKIIIYNFIIIAYNKYIEISTWCIDISIYKWYHYKWMEGDYYMSNLTSAINVNVPTDVKREATNLFNSLGISMSTAINMFLKKSIYECGIPFDLKQEPSKEVIEALKEIENIENGNSNKKGYHNMYKLLEDLEK